MCIIIWNISYKILALSRNIYIYNHIANIIVQTVTIYNDMTDVINTCESMNLVSIRRSKAKIESKGMNISLWYLEEKILDNITDIKWVLLLEVKYQMIDSIQYWLDIEWRGIGIDNRYQIFKILIRIDTF